MKSSMLTTILPVLKGGIYRKPHAYFKKKIIKLKENSFIYHFKKQASKKQTNKKPVQY